MPVGGSQRIVTDANALFPASLRDTLFRAHEAGLVEVRLREQIWAEVTRNLLDTGWTVVKNEPDCRQPAMR